MLFLVAITALLCSSSIYAGPSIQFFFPQNIDASSCAGAISWTKWFNEAKPSDNGNLDKEVLPVIQATHGRDVCATPLAMHVQSVSDLSADTSYSGSWSLMNNVIAGFQSNTDGIDYQVRFCCANTDFTPTTTTTTTPRPITSSTCGLAQIKHSLPSSRIFGGTHATANSWPWQVLYEERKMCGENECLGLCGGTLIDDRHVLTASHCLGTTNPALITITAGLHNKYQNEADTRQVRTVERIFNHPNYISAEIGDDIAILRLAQPVQFNKYVQPACLPGPDPQPNDDVVLIGWGALELGGSAYHELKQAKLKVVGDCYKYWGGQLNDEKQICVANTATGESACQGDSGGPMLYQRNGQWIVGGVTSYGSGGGCTTFSNSLPNVYTRVSAYLPWIQSIIQ
jgi:hypothetical protein